MLDQYQQALRSRVYALRQLRPLIAIAADMGVCVGTLRPWLRNTRPITTRTLAKIEDWCTAQETHTSDMPSRARA